MSSDSRDDESIDDLRERIAELEARIPDGPSRRQVLAGGGLLAAGGLLGGGASQQVSAQTAAGQVGTSSEPVDVEAATLNGGSVNAGELNRTVLANEQPGADIGIQINNALQVLKDNYNMRGTVELHPGEYNGVSQLDYPSGIDGSERFTVKSRGGAFASARLNFDTSVTRAVDNTVDTNTNQVVTFEGLWFNGQNAIAEGIYNDPNLSPDRSALIRCRISGFTEVGYRAGGGTTGDLIYNCRFLDCGTQTGDSAINTDGGTVYIYGTNVGRGQRGINDGAGANIYASGLSIVATNDTPIELSNNATQAYISNFNVFNIKGGSAGIVSSGPDLFLSNGKITGVPGHGVDIGGGRAGVSNVISKGNDNAGFNIRTSTPSLLYPIFAIDNNQSNNNFGGVRLGGASNITLGGVTTDTQSTSTQAFGVNEFAAPTPSNNVVLHGYYQGNAGEPINKQGGTGLIVAGRTVSAERLTLGGSNSNVSPNKTQNGHTTVKVGAGSSNSTNPTLQGIDTVAREGQQLTITHTKVFESDDITIAHDSSSGTDPILLNNGTNITLSTDGASIMLQYDDRRSKWMQVSSDPV